MCACVYVHACVCVCVCVCVQAYIHISYITTLFLHSIFLCIGTDARIKSKFWGKSMEVFPIGLVNVTLPK